VVAEMMAATMVPVRTSVLMVVVMAARKGPVRLGPVPPATAPVATVMRPPPALGGPSLAPMASLRQTARPAMTGAVMYVLMGVATAAPRIRATAVRPLRVNGAAMARPLAAITVVVEAPPGNRPSVGLRFG